MASAVGSAESGSGQRTWMSGWLGLGVTFWILLYQLHHALATTTPLALPAIRSNFQPRRPFNSVAERPLPSSGTSEGLILLKAFCFGRPTGITQAHPSPGAWRRQRREKAPSKPQLWMLLAFHADQPAPNGSQRSLLARVLVDDHERIGNFKRHSDPPDGERGQDWTGHFARAIQSIREATLHPLRCLDRHIVAFPRDLSSCQSSEMTSALPRGITIPASQLPGDDV